MSGHLILRRYFFNTGSIESDPIDLFVPSGAIKPILGSAIGVIRDSPSMPVTAIRGISMEKETLQFALRKTQHITTAVYPGCNDSEKTIVIGDLVYLFEEQLLLEDKMTFCFEVTDITGTTFTGKIRSFGNYNGDDYKGYKEEDTIEFDKIYIHEFRPSRVQ
jgi:hypothetical protein